MVKRRWLLLFLALAIPCMTSTSLQECVGATPRSWRTVQDTYMDEIPRIVARARDSVVLVRVYAMYCPACCRELSLINSYAGQFGEENLTVINLCVDREPKELKDVLENNSIYFFPYWVKDFEKEQLKQVIKRIGGDYQGRIPYTLLIDRTGRARYDWTGSRGANTYNPYLIQLLEE